MTTAIVQTSWVRAWELRTCPSRAPDSLLHWLTAWLCWGSRDQKSVYPSGLSAPVWPPAPPHAPQALGTLPTDPGWGCQPRSLAHWADAFRTERRGRLGAGLSCLATGCGGESDGKQTGKGPRVPEPSWDTRCPWPARQGRQRELCKQVTPGRPALWAPPCPGCPDAGVAQL